MAAMGDPNASIPTPQPVHFRPMFAGYGGAMAASSFTFMSKAALDGGIPARSACSGRRSRSRARAQSKKTDMVLNGATPHIEVDPETYEVRADGVLLTCEPASVLPMAQRYFLF